MPKTSIVALVLAASLAGCSKPAPYNTTSTVKDIMAGITDPQAQVFWHSSGANDTANGTETLTPTTKEGWDAAEHAMTAVAESGNLLMLRPRADDNGDWVKFAKAMTDQALLARAAVRAKNGDKMFETGASLYETCTACHAKYLLPFLDSNGKMKPVGKDGKPAA
jgi:cytochrome c553